MHGSDRSFGLVVLIRTVRFAYLLWGGMLLSSLVLTHRLRVPDPLLVWPWVVRIAATPWFQGGVLGLGLVMAVASLLEVWELVDALLVHFLHDHEHDR